MRSLPWRSVALAFLLFSACGGYGSNNGVGYGGMPASCPAGTQAVIVGSGPYGMSFSPAGLTIHLNDTVCWTWAGGPHSVVSGTVSGASCIADNAFCFPANTNCAAVPTAGLGTLYMHKFTSTGTFPYFCSVHCTMGMVGSITVLP